MKIYCLILVFLLIVVTAEAGHITAPPPLKDLPVSLQHYLKQLYDNFNVLETVIVNPDGVRNGKMGEQLYLQTGGLHYHCINTDGSTVWRCEEITDTP